MGTRIGEDDDCYELTVEDLQYLIENKVLKNPKNGLHFKVKEVDYHDDSVLIECVETEAAHMVQLGWLKKWFVL